MPFMVPADLCIRTNVLQWNQGFDKRKSPTVIKYRMAALIDACRQAITISLLFNPENIFFPPLVACLREQAFPPLGKSLDANKCSVKGMEKKS